MRHTPTPWCVETPMGDETPWIVEAGKETYEWRCIAMVSSDDPINSEDRDPVKPILEPEAAANAAFIVRACNSHDELVKVAIAALHALRSYQYGNAAPDLAQGIASELQGAIDRATTSSGAG